MVISCGSGDAGDACLRSACGRIYRTRMLLAPWDFMRILRYFRPPTTRTLSPTGADAGSFTSRCWASRGRGQCTGTGPVDSSSVDGVHSSDLLTKTPRSFNVRRYQLAFLSSVAARVLPSEKL